MIATVDIGITGAEIAAIEQKLRTHMESDPQKYGNGLYCYILNMKSHLKVELHVYYTLAFNGSYFAAKHNATHRILLCFQKALLELGVSFAGTDGIIYTQEPSTESTGPTMTNNTNARTNASTNADLLSSIDEYCDGDTEVDDFGEQARQSGVSSPASGARTEDVGLRRRWVRHVSGMKKLDYASSDT